MGDDPLWRCMDSSKSLTREQLELVIQKKKTNEVFAWFQDHFVNCTKAEYIARCPIVLLQGPTGCGKTSTLKWISNELKVPIKEFSETTDITAIKYDLARAFSEEEKANLTSSIDRRKAHKFEHFVINSIRYNTLYPPSDSPESNVATAAEEFDSSDDEEFIELTSSLPKPPPPQPTGIIVHVETSLTFTRSQRILIQSLCRLIKVIKEISLRSLRRVAIVFETLEGECETVSLPTRIKVSLRIQVFKFNPITRANMKKLVEALMKNLKHSVIDKETIEQLVSDCDGDIRACINTLQLICNRSTNPNALCGINKNLLDGRTQGTIVIPRFSPASKKQKLNHEKVKHVRLNPSLMRDTNRSLGFFHVLGKIFYQKRLYPEFAEDFPRGRLRKVDRPFPTENSTEYLVNMIGVDPRNLIAWLHQHYYKFCGEHNIDKAALFLENLSDIDTLSLNSLQSSQFYEMHNSLDQIQTFASIECTVYSLYQDQSRSTKPSHRKVQTSEGPRLVKSSVETMSSLSNNNGDLYSFNKPPSMSLPKLVEDYQTLLGNCTTRLLHSNSAHLDPTKVLVDYIPYLRLMSDSLTSVSSTKRSMFNNSKQHPIFEDDKIIILLNALDRIEERPECDFDDRHERLLELNDEVDINEDEMEIG